MSDACDDAESQHRPVLLAELLDGLNIDARGCYIDATCGQGGHSAALLQRLGPEGRVIAFDKDAQACRRARTALADDARFTIRHAPFTALANLAEEGMAGRAAGVFFDLGVSSNQLNAPERGFSFMHSGPLDMRMDTGAGATAAQWLNTATAADIRRVLKEYGEERNAAKIAAAIVRRRPLQTTGELAALVEGVSGRGGGKHPATRTFLAIRLFINRELEELTDALAGVPRLLRCGGRLAVITFHSLEDRIVKRFIKAHSEPRRAPRGLPVADDASGVVLAKVGKPQVPGDREVALNSRARSARLRIAERL